MATKRKGFWSDLQDAERSAARLARGVAALAAEAPAGGAAAELYEAQRGAQLAADRLRVVAADVARAEK